RALLRVIMRCEPREENDTLGLPSALFKLFQLVVVMERRLMLPPAHIRNLLIKGAHHLICQTDKKVRIRPRSLACLCAWVTASCSIGGENGCEAWDQCRNFLVDLLQLYPGCSHLALLSALQAFSRSMLRMNNYRVETGLEKVIFWIAYHGPWVGAKVVRENLVQLLERRLAVRHKFIPDEDPVIIAKSVLDLLAGVKTKSCENPVSALVVLVRWQGSHWLVKTLISEVMTTALKALTVDPLQETDEGQQQTPQTDAAQTANAAIQHQYYVEVIKHNFLLLIRKLVETLQNTVNKQELLSSLQDNVFNSMKTYETKGDVTSSRIIALFKKEICDIVK
ncbi:unnamed protein product, partial [Meganyctiphanes norvegica]